MTNWDRGSIVNATLRGLCVLPISVISRHNKKILQRIRRHRSLDLKVPNTPHKQTHIPPFFSSYHFTHLLVLLVVFFLPSLLFVFLLLRLNQWVQRLRSGIPLKSLSKLAMTTLRRFIPHISPLIPPSSFLK